MASKTPCGHPTTFTEALGAEIVASIRADHCSRMAAAESAGIDESTVRGWESTQPAFSRAMKKARGEVKRSVARHLKEAADDGEVAARIFRAKTLDPGQFQERRDHGRVDPAEFIAGIHAAVEKARQSDGLEPPDASADG